MTLQTQDSPIACTLAAGDFKARIAWIADLNAASLLSHRRDDLTLELTYQPQARDQVRQMVAQEQACCGFLAFDLREADDAIRLTIVAPEAAREAAETVFEPFQAKSNSANAGCACCSGAAA